MRHHLTDYDHAVMAAAKIGALKRQGPVWFMGGVNCMASLYRLEQAGEFYIAIGGDILFPGTDEYKKAEAREQLIVDFKRGLRDGSIKVLVDKDTKIVKGVIKNQTKGPKT